MIRLEGGRPGDERGFVHKRLLGGIKGFISGGFNPLAAAAGFLTPPRQRPRTTRRQPTVRAGTLIGTTDFVGRPPARRTLPRTITARPSAISAEEKEAARSLKFGPIGEFITGIGERIFGGGGAPGAPSPHPDRASDLRPDHALRPTTHSEPRGTVCVGDLSPWCSDALW